MTLISAVIAVLALRLLLPTVSDLRSAWARQRFQPRGAHRSDERALVLIPAHDEEAVLAQCLTALREAAPGFAATRIVVVADNCTDGTASIALAHGVECIERRDTTRTGKPAAIAWALDRLAPLATDVLVIVDADTEVAFDFFSALAAAGPWARRAGQARQLLHNADLNWLTRLSALFVECRYGIALPLKARAGLNCPLLGTGSVYGQRILDAIDWSDLGPAEDLEIYAILTARGTGIDYVPGAVVRVPGEATLSGGAAQRRRWTAGRVRASLHRTTALLRSPRIAAHQKLDALAELFGPGPVEHLLWVLGGTAAVWTLRPPAASILIALLTVTLIRPAAYSAISLGRQPRPLRMLVALLFLPLYTAWRLALALTLAPVLASGRWEKTKRSSPGSSTRDSAH